jgi:hypothetical protein
MGARDSAAGWLLLAVLLLPNGAYAQEPVTLAASEAPPEIVVDTLAVLGDPDGPGILASENVYITADARGRYFVFALPYPVIQEYDDAGRFVRSIGREGDGPGEFRWPQAVHVDDAGRVHVADGVHQRLTSLTGDGSAPRTLPLSPLNPGFELTAITPDSLLLTGYGLSSELAGEPLHVVSWEGGVERSFGASRGLEQGSDPVELVRSIHSVSADTLWVAPMDEYRIERWSLDGELRAVFLGDGSIGFDREELDEVRGLRPRTVLSAVRQDASGLVWVKLHVPRADWKDVVGAADEEELSDLRLTDTLLEVVDPASGTVVASRRLPGRHTRFFGDHQIGEIAINPQDLSVEVLVLSLGLQGIGLAEPADVR